MLLEWNIIVFRIVARSILARRLLGPLSARHDRSLEAVPEGLEDAHVSVIQVEDEIGIDRIRTRHALRQRHQGGDIGVGLSAVTRLLVDDVAIGVLAENLGDLEAPHFLVREGKAAPGLQIGTQLALLGRGHGIAGGDHEGSAVLHALVAQELETDKHLLLQLGLALVGGVLSAEVDDPVAAQDDGSGWGELEGIGVAGGGEAHTISFVCKASSIALITPTYCFRWLYLCLNNRSMALASACSASFRRISRSLASFASRTARSFASCSARSLRWRSSATRRSASKASRSALMRVSSFACASRDTRSRSSITARALRSASSRTRRAWRSSSS